jgi:hypothetical protein
MKSFLPYPIRQTARCWGVFAALSTLAISTPGQASIASGGRVTAYFVDDSGLVLFDTDGSRTATPVCAGPKNNFSFRADTVAKQAMFASIVTAWSTGRTVLIGGAGTCPDEPTVERAGNIILQ